MLIFSKNNYDIPDFTMQHSGNKWTLRRNLAQAIIWIGFLQHSYKFVP